MPAIKPSPFLLLPVAVIAGLIIGGRYIDNQRAKQQSTLSGFFESEPAQVASRVAGRVARIDVAEGQTVTAGTLLLDLDAAPAQADTAAKIASARQAREQLREMRNGPRSQDIAKQAAIVAEKRANLEKLQNGSRPEEIGAAQARLQNAEAELRKLQAGPRPEEVAQALAAEREAKAQYAASERGMTAEDRAQVKERLDDATAQETLAKADADRYEKLFRQEAVTRQQWDQAQANLRGAQARRQEADAAWRRADEGTPTEERQQAQQNYLHAKANADLVRAGSRREDIDAGIAAVAEARQNLTLLQRGSRPEDIAAAAAQLSQAEATLAELQAGNRAEQIAAAKAAADAAKQTAASAEVNLAESQVRAPTNGVVERIPVAVGDLVTSGTTLARITDPTDIWIRVYVPEASLARVSVGGKATLRLDGIETPVDAVVESVATQGEFTPVNLETPDERGKQVFAVRLRLAHSDSAVKPGMYATVTRIGDWEP